MSTSAETEGPLVGTGRSADVFEYGQREVLRRYREPRDTELEVAAMEHARLHGFPVPAARALSATDILMERIHGPTMLTDLARRPWLVSRHAATLADLHERLHAIPGPSWLAAPLGDGNALLHLDLHPDNVLLTRDGPQVIDWPNAARGPALADVAHTWLVLACAAAPGGVYHRVASAAGRGLFLERFLRHFPRGDVASQVEPVGAFRLAHRNLPEAEREAIAGLIAKVNNP
jgi:aminoglycoside phosphotransferase (APT) family kinase protein